MTKKLRSLLSNNWVVGISTSVAGTIMLAKSADWFEATAQGIGTLFPRYALVLGRIAVVVGLVGIVLKIRNWILIRFRDQNVLLAWEPLLRLANRLRRREFDSSTLQVLAERFRTFDGSRYYDLSGFGEAMPQPYAGHARDAPVVVLGIPARRHMAIPDFQDLRLLRMVIGCGGRVLVVVLDIHYPGAPMIASNERTEATVRMVRRVLGSVARVTPLSDLLASEAPNTFRYLFNYLIPFWAESFDKINGFRQHGSLTIDDGPVFRTISFLRLGLELKAIEQCVSSRDKVILIQWKQRLYKWNTAPDFLRTRLPELNFAGLLIGEDFLEPGGMKVPASTPVPGGPLFMMTDSPREIAIKLLARHVDSLGLHWELSDDYLRVLASNVIGLTGADAATRWEPAWLDRWRMLRFIRRYAPADAPLLQQENLLASLRLRRRVFTEFGRIHRSLLR